MIGLELNIQALINHGSVYCVKRLNQLMQSSTDTYCKSVKCLLYCDCGFTNDNPRSVGTHMRYCDGSPPEQHSRKLKCSFCKLSTESEAGLQVHLARNHPEVRNEQMREKVKKLRWTEQKLEFLVETIQRLKWEGVKNVNSAAANILPNITETAIQKITLPE